MQRVSKSYKTAMKQPLRNRGYIRAYIGVINSKAQKYVNVEASNNDFTYFSNLTRPFNGYTADRLYATTENDFTKVDGSMYFLPEEDSSYELYNNGLVSNTLLGYVYVTFSGQRDFDIKGLTIDFSACYPTSFDIEWDGGINSYTNDKQLFTTEDVFEGVSYFKITANSMVNGNGRLRVLEMRMGIVNSFSNNDILNYSYKEYVSPICESIPSEDMSLTVDNQNLYYCPDNPSSTLAFFEQGQEINIIFGYDVSGNGDIEWLPANTCYLKSWSATDTEAKFTAVDRFDYIDSTYYKGKYREDGITLYDLALDVLEDMGITDTREYYLDPYLKDVIVYNPIPKVKHSQALQIIANAGRCTLYIDRNKRICMQSAFVPEFTPKCNNETDYSNIENVLNGEDKIGYAEASYNFSAVDGTMTFRPDDSSEYLSNTGYISNSFYTVDDEGNGSWDGDVPVITITLDASFNAFGLAIDFRETYPEEFTIQTYNDDVLVNDYTYTNLEGPDFITDDEFERYNKMVITFTKGPANSRIFIDNIALVNFTDYTLTRDYDLTGSLTATRQDKTKKITVVESLYADSLVGEKSLKSETITLTAGDTEYTIYLTNPSYGYRAEISDNTDIQVEIIDSSSYFVTIKITGVTADDTAVKYTVYGYEYLVTSNNYAVSHELNGQEIIWTNPLISSDEMANKLEEWLAVTYCGDVEYSIPWRGDPRVDGNDIFKLEIKDRGTVLIHAYQNELKFSGAWSCTTKARKADMKWR